MQGKYNLGLCSCFVGVFVKVAPLLPGAIGSTEALWRPCTLAWLCLPDSSGALWASADPQGICDGIAVPLQNNRREIFTRYVPQSWSWWDEAITMLPEFYSVLLSLGTAFWRKSCCPQWGTEV